MPKGVLLLVFLLLIGGIYYFFLSSPPKEITPPSIILSPVVEEGVVGLDGKIKLTGDGEYRVEGRVYISSNGITLKEEEINTTLKGPTDYPITLPPTRVEGKATVGADITVKGDTILRIKEEVPVEMPHPIYLTIPPSFSIYPTSVSPTENGYDVTLRVELSNPNEESLDIKDAKVKVEDSTYNVSISKLDGNERKHYDIPVSIDGNTLSGELSLSYSISGKKRTVVYNFSLSFPPFSQQRPLYRLSYSITSLSNEGVKLRIKLFLKNEGALPYTAKDLRIKIRGKDGIVKEVNLGNVTIPPLSEKNITKDVSAVPLLIGGSIEVYEGDERVVSVPLELVSSDLIKPPSVEINIEEVNGTGADKVHLIITNTNDFNINVKDVDIAVYRGTTNLTSDFSSSPVEIDDKHTFTAETTFLSGLLKIVVKYTYGLESLGLWFNEQITTYYRAS